MIFRSLGLLLLCVSIAVTSLPATATRKLSTTEVRSSLIYNIAKYITWPDYVYLTPGQNFNFCFLEPDDAAHYNFLAMQQPFKVGDKATSFILLNDLSSLKEKHCQVIFIGEQAVLNKADVRKIKKLNKYSMTITSDKRLAEKGLLLYLLEKREKIHIYVNKSELQLSKLKISTKLLRRMKFGI